ncbi:GGDEF domain-containing protein [Rhodobacteraceae bacterium DSL-40]|uniref:GGDEF domain-containing protein n=1 Tax=Amaricoccus sp. B4 TaxID=3368557 RepID=UPI000DAB5CC4
MIISRYERATRTGQVIRLDGIVQFTQRNGLSSGEMTIVLRDIGERKTWKRELDALAFTDAITGLANRRGFDLAIGHYCQDTTYIGSRLSPILIDLDHFKEVNDHFGHQVSDDYLRVIATFCGRA